MVNGSEPEQEQQENQTDLQVGITDDFQILMVVSTPEVIMTPDIAMQLGRHFIKAAKEARVEKEKAEGPKIITPDSKIIVN